MVTHPICRNLSVGMACDRLHPDVQDAKPSKPWTGKGEILVFYSFKGLLQSQHLLLVCQAPEHHGSNSGL